MKTAIGCVKNGDYETCQNARKNSLACKPLLVSPGQQFTNPGYKLIPPPKAFAVSRPGSSLQNRPSSLPHLRRVTSDPNYGSTTIGSQALALQRIRASNGHRNVSQETRMSLKAHAIGGWKKQYYVDRAPRMVIWMENAHLLAKTVTSEQQIRVLGYCRHEGTGMMSEHLKPKQILEGKRMVDWNNCFKIVSKNIDVAPLVVRAKNKREFWKWMKCLDRNNVAETRKPMRGYLWTKPAEECWFFELKDDTITMSEHPGKTVARTWTGLDKITMVPHEEGIILNESNGWQATVTFQFPSTVSNALIKGWQRIYLTVEPHISEDWQSDMFFVRSSNRHSRDAVGRRGRLPAEKMPLRICPRPPPLDAPASWVIVGSGSQSLPREMPAQHLLAPTNMPTPMPSPNISMPRMSPGAAAWGSRAPANPPFASTIGQMHVRHPLQSIWPRFQVSGRNLPTVDTTPRSPDMLSMERPSWEQQQTPSIMKRTRRSSSNSIQMVCEQRTRRSSTNSVKMVCEHEDLRQQRTRRSSTNSMLGSSTNSILGSPANSMLGSPANSILGSPANSFLGSPANSILGSPANSILGSPANSILGKMDCEQEDVEDASLLLFLGNKDGLDGESPSRKKMKVIC